MNWLAANVEWVAPLGVGVAVFLAVSVMFWPRQAQHKSKSNLRAALIAQSGRARLG